MGKSAKEAIEEVKRANRTVNLALNKTGIALLCAHLHHESAGFARVEENLMYSAERITEVFKIPSAEAKSLARNPEGLANRVYEGRMGNNRPGDGWRFRGRGYIQLTGRANYASLSAYPLLNEPDLAARQPMLIALEWVKLQPKLVVALNAGDVRLSTKIINGGYNGLADRTVLFEKYKKEVENEHTA